MPTYINPQALDRACALLGVSRTKPGENQPNRARDQTILFLGKNLRALANLGCQPSVSLEDLYSVKLLPAVRLEHPIANAKRHGIDRQGGFLFNDIAAINEDDLTWLEGLQNIGEYSMQLLQSLRDIYLETNRFQELPGIQHGSRDEIVVSEQEALILRVAERVRNDPKARKRLFDLFPPG